MKNKASLFSIILVLFLFAIVRLQFGKINVRNTYNVATWDAFGYYMYLPSIFIYEDVKELKWVPKIDSVYNVTGGVFYQAGKIESGTYTNKYLMGVAVMQSPFFTIAHLSADKKDGFSKSYQYGIIWAALFYTILGFYFLRKVLLHYFTDNIVAVTILALAFCSNLVQYVAIDSAQSHCYIFSLYAIVLWLTYKWHEKPGILWAFLLGLISGLAVICRPTEIIIIFIPLLWNINPKDNAQQKWKLLWENKSHLLLYIFGAILGAAPQLIYWKYTTGSWIYDVGSKWFFFNPWFRVLFGPEKGWFLYTPIAIFMVLGFFFLKKYPFQKAILTFCLLNIWIIISWSDWRYGGSYSTRALVQSYPVFAFSLAAFIGFILKKRKGWLLFPILIAFLILNFYQLKIYNTGIGESFSPLLKITGSK